LVAGISSNFDIKVLHYQFSGIDRIDCGDIKVSPRLSDKANPGKARQEDLQGLLNKHGMIQREEE
jgi:hypothetical protein